MGNLADAKLAGALEASVVESYRAEIEVHVKESHYTDALEKLIDFTRDCSPGDRKEAIVLYSRYSLWKSAERRGVRNSEGVNEIVQAILDLCDLIASRAHIRGELALSPVDFADLHERDNATKLAGGDDKDRPVNGDATRSAAQVRTTPHSLPEGHAKETVKGSDQQEHLERFSNPDAIGNDRSSEQKLKSGLSQQALDGALQTYLKFWRSTLKSDEDTLVVRCRDLVKNFGGTSFSLGPMSFDLVAGEITGVIGMNASGKTTLLRLLLGELAPTSGSIVYPKLSGHTSDWASIKNQIGSVAQMPERWYGRLRLNLNYTAAAYGSTGRQNDELVDWYVHRYGLKEYEDATWDRISGGFKVRFELVRALLSKPKLLVLDEPLAYLDIVTQQIFLSDIRSISSALDNPIPIIVTSQHLYEIEAVANKMVILDDGNCLFSGLISETPHLKDFRTYEITVHCDKKELLEVLRPFGLIDVEVTMTSYIITSQADCDYTKFAMGLISHFGDRLTYLRDITRSTRSLFRNKRDDIVHQAPIRANAPSDALRSSADV